MLTVIKTYAQVFRCWEVGTMFQVGDKIVHPMHGAGVIDSIVQKKINGVVRE